MAALRVQGGLVKKKMKGGVYNKPPYSRPPPLTCFFSIGTPLSANNFLFADTVSANNFLFADTLSANNLFQYKMHYHLNPKSWFKLYLELIA